MNARLTTLASGMAIAALVVILSGMLLGVGMADAGGKVSSVPAGDAAGGERIFQQSCSSCHGDHGAGVDGRGPSLVGVGAQAADFELSTGRMPLANPQDEPVRSRPAFSTSQQRALVAFIGSLGGPGVPEVDPGAGSLVTGRELFASNCASCHQITGSGGVVPGASVPPLDSATPTQIAEAVRVGPYLMPRFSPRELNAREVDGIAAYVLSTRAPADPGGWSIGHLGPVPEGLVAWGIGILVLLVVARLIGERTPA